MRAKLTILAGLVAITFATARAETPKPGAVDFASLGLGSDEEASVEVNLSGPLLQLAASATDDEDDPGLSQMLSKLDAITVRTYSMEGKSPDAYDKQVAALSRKLEADGWQTIVKVREKDERAHIAVKMVGDRIVGLTVIAFDHDDELAFINIVGDIDMKQIGRLGKHMNIDALDSLDDKDLKTPTPQKPKK
jgi:hypothetical protein